MIPEKPQIFEAPVTTLAHAQEYLDNQENALLAKLPLEVIMQILRHLPLNAISAIGLSCKHINLQLRNDQLWRFLFNSRFIPSIPDGTYLEPGACLKAYKKEHNINPNIANGVYALHTLMEHSSAILSLAIADGTLFSGSYGSVIKEWDLETNKYIRGWWSTNEIGILSLAVAGGKLFSGSRESTISIRDLKTNKRIHTLDTLEGHKGKVYSLAIADEKLYSGSADTTIKIWDLETNQCIHTLEGHTGDVHSLVLANGMLYSGSADTTIKIWDLETNQCIHTLEGYRGAVYSLAVAGKRLFSGLDDGKIRIWDLETCEYKDMFEGYGGTVYSLAVADKWLFSGPDDGTIRIWDLETNQCIRKLEGHKGAVRSFALEGGKLISCSDDKTIRIWDFSAPDRGIFAEIATLFRSGDFDEAMKRFSRMPVKARNAIYGELYHILKPFANDYMGCAQHAFHNQYKLSSTERQKAQAIENYLKS